MITHSISWKKTFGLLAGAALSVSASYGETDWTGPETISGVQGATAVISADFNNDGLDDVGVFDGGRNSGDIPYLHWLEAPNWTKHQLHGTLLGNFTGAAEAADFNGDGHMDIVVAGGNHGGGTGEVFVYINPGGGAVTGYWTRHLVYSLSDCFHQNDLKVDDMDGDGKPDIIVRAKSNSGKRVMVTMQDSVSSWTTRYWPTPNNTSDQKKSEGLATGDLDGDGYPEIVLSGVYWSNSGGWRTGEPSEHVVDNALKDQEVKTAVADLDGDGDRDIFMASAEGPEIHVAVYLNDGTPGNGAWPRDILKNGFGKCHLVTVADFDGNGTTDLVAGRSFNKKGVYVWYNDGSANFTEAPINTTEGYYSGQVGDLDGDGDLDLVGSKTISSGPMHIYRNQYDGAPPVNQAPSVEAGANQTITLGETANLNGVVTDDWLPAGSTVAIQWSQQSGPGTVTFGNAGNPQTTAEFSQEGTYVLELTADDTEYTAADTVSITVTPGGGGGGGSNIALGIIPTASDPERVEKLTDGTTSRWFSNNFADDGDQWIEIALNGSPTIDRVVLVQGVERTDDWYVEVYNGAGWTQVASGTNNTDLSVTASFNPVSAERVRFTVTTGQYYLKVEELEVYEADAGGGGNQAPMVLAGPDTTAEVGQVLALAGSVSDDGLPSSGQLTSQWTQQSGPGTASFGDATDPNTTVVFDTEGTYVLRLTADDTELTASQELTVTVTTTGGQPVNVAPEGTATASKPDNTANLNDGVLANNSRWFSNDIAADGPQWMEIAFAETRQISSVVLRQQAERADDWYVEIHDGSDWVQVAAGTGNAEVDITASFAPVSTDRVRFTVTSGQYYLKIFELEVFAH